MFFFLLACFSSPKVAIPEQSNSELLDADGDGFWGDDDCDDLSSLIHPNAVEICDGVDNNCNGEVDEGVDSTFYLDADGDGFGTEDHSIQGCTAPEGYVLSGSDCNDQNDQVYPSSVEICDGIDNNCDEQIDEGLTGEGFFDGDGDGFGGEASSGCFDEGLVEQGGDCNDGDEHIHPESVEICDGIDNNCDEQIDEGVTGIWYFDQDLDGYGSSSSIYEGCEQPSGYVENATDCDDLDVVVFPGAAELCDYIDNNCDGQIDEDGSNWFEDADGDGYGNSNAIVNSCSPISGYVQNDSDCDDTHIQVNPAADEYCNTIDDNCNGQIDEDGAVDGILYFPDSDGDGFGDSSSSHTACSTPNGYVQDNSDCDDQNIWTYPGAAELDSISQCMTDEDEDGFGDTLPTLGVDAGTDCDDSLDSVFLGADEYCNTIDDNCNGQIDEDTALDALTWYSDSDGDGFGDLSTPVQSCYISSGIVADSTDCDDGQQHVYPGAQEQCDGLDGDCDGAIDAPNALSPPTWYIDVDGDGFGNTSVSLTECGQPVGYVQDDSDCDDQNIWTYPGAAELDSISQCMTDEDEDGFGDTLPTLGVDAGTDCDDSLDSVFLGADEYCNTIDDNCNGQIDEDTALDALTWYGDSDGDGFGDLSTPVQSCYISSGIVADSTDCDDSLSDIHPAQTEICDDGLDNNCDGLIDDLDEDTCSPYDFEIEIPSDQVHFNIDTYIGQPTNSVDIYIYIPNGVRIYSNSPSIPAFSTDGLPTGSTVTLINDGIIHGKGGNGACESGGAGQDGGDAIWATIDMTIDTSIGGIYGGGGGGGSGDDPKGGGGGAGGGSGCDGGANGDYNGNGGRGSIRSNGGYASGGSGVNYNGAYASGGNWGVPAGNGSGGSGGSGGYCTGSNQQGQGGGGGGWGGGAGGGCAHSSSRNPGAGGEGGWAVRTYAALITWDGIYNTNNVKGWVQ